MNELIVPNKDPYICREFAWWFDYPQTSSTGWRMAFECMLRAKSLLGWPNKSGCSYLSPDPYQCCRRQLMEWKG